MDHEMFEQRQIPGGVSLCPIVLVQIQDKLAWDTKLVPTPEAENKSMESIISRNKGRYE